MTDAATGSPVQDATIITSAGYTCNGKPDGTYLFQNPPGQITVTAEAPGYVTWTRSVNVADLHTLILDIQLQPLAGATGWLAGTVTDAETGLPIANAIIETGDGFSVFTFADGAYAIDLPIGLYTVTARASGYHFFTKSGITVGDQEEITVNFQLTPYSTSTNGPSNNEPSDDEPYNNEPPTIDAGPDRSVGEGAEIILDGSGFSSGDVTLCVWTQIAVPPVALSDPFSDSPRFTSPVVGEQGADLTFRLTVVDGQCSKASDDITIHVSGTPLPPTQSYDTPEPDAVFPDNPADAVSPVSTFQIQLPENMGEGNTHDWTRWQISRDADFSSIVLDTSSASHLTALPVPDFVLEGNTAYFWRARININETGESDWSAPATFETGPDQMDGAESKCNGDADLDGNGVPDKDQADMRCLKTADGQYWLGVKIADNVASVESMNCADHNAVADAEGKPEKMPFGLIGFRIKLKTIGDTANVTVYFPEAIAVGAKWYSHNRLEGWRDNSNHAVFSEDGRSVVLAFRDGGFGDVDGAANGVIVDPSGLVGNIATATNQDGVFSRPTSDVGRRRRGMFYRVRDGIADFVGWVER